MVSILNERRGENKHGVWFSIAPWFDIGTWFKNITIPSTYRRDLILEILKSLEALYKVVGWSIPLTGAYRLAAPSQCGQPGYIRVSCSGLTCHYMASFILASLRQSFVVPFAHAGRKRLSVPPDTGHTASIDLFWPHATPCITIRPLPAGAQWSLAASLFILSLAKFAH